MWGRRELPQIPQENTREWSLYGGVVTRCLDHWGSPPQCRPQTDTQSSGVLCDWPQKRGFPEAQNTPESNFLPFVGKIMRKRELGIFFGISRVFKEMLFSEKHLVRNLAEKLTPPNFSGPFLHHLWELPAVLSSTELGLKRCPSIQRRDTTLEELPVRIHKFLWLHKETDDKIEDQTQTEMTLTTSINIITERTLTSYMYMK